MNWSTLKVLKYPDSLFLFDDTEPHQGSISLTLYKHVYLIQAHKMMFISISNLAGGSTAQATKMPAKFWDVRLCIIRIERIPSNVHRASTRIFARGCRDISRGCTRRKKVKGQSKNIMGGKIPADADRYRADGCVGRRQLTEALVHFHENESFISTDIDKARSIYPIKP